MAELGGSIEKLASPDVVFKPFSVLFIARQAYQLLVTDDAFVRRDESSHSKAAQTAQTSL